MSERNETTAVLLRDYASLREWRKHRTVTLVISAGGLHSGHTAAIAEAASTGNDVLVAIFNPELLQRDEAESFDEERLLAADLAVATAAGADAVYAPSLDAFFPYGLPRVSFDLSQLFAVLAQLRQEEELPQELQTQLRNTALIAAKMLNLTRPHVLVMGQNDFARLAVIRHLLRDLDYPTELRTVPTDRDVNGLATSRHNEALTDSEYEAALVINKALRAGVQAAAAQLSVEQVLDQVWQELKEQAGVKVKYLALVDPVTLGEPEGVPMATALLVIGAVVGGVELSDNTLVMIRRGYGAYTANSLAEF